MQDDQTKHQAADTILMYNMSVSEKRQSVYFCEQPKGMRLQASSPMRPQGNMKVADLELLVRGSQPRLLDGAGGMVGHF